MPGIVDGNNPVQIKVECKEVDPEPSYRAWGPGPATLMGPMMEGSQAGYF